MGGLIFREKSDLAQDLVFNENYLGKTDATFTLNFSTGSAMVLAQYYNFVRYGRDGYRYIMETMQYNARRLAERIRRSASFRLVGEPGDEQLPLVAFQLEGDHDYDEFDVRAIGRRARLDDPGVHAAARRQHVTIMRALVKLTLGHSLTRRSATDIAKTCDALRQKGGLHEADRNG